MAERRILEIGPARMPLHNRGDFSLEEDEKYFGLDRWEGIFQEQEWKKLKNDFGDKICLVRGNRIDLPFEDESMNEIVMLGTAPTQEHAHYLQAIDEANRVLSSGGLIRIGSGFSVINDTYSTWGEELKKKGYTFLPNEIKKYSFDKEVRQKRLGLQPHHTDLPYIVIAYKKP